MDAAPAEEVETGDRDQNGEHGDDGTRQYLVGRKVDDLVQVEFFVFGHVLTNTVKNNDGVVERISGQGQQGGDDEQGKLHIHHPTDAQDDEHIVKGGHGGGQAELEIKTEPEVENNAKHGQADGEDGLAPQVGRDRGADL